MLSCRSCGGRLEITEDVDRFACAYCGTEQIVNRSGGIVTLQIVSDKLDRMTVGIDKTAAELAITRLSSELKELRETEASLNTSIKKESRALSQIEKYKQALAQKYRTANSIGGKLTTRYIPHITVGGALVAVAGFAFSETGFGNFLSIAGSAIFFIGILIALANRNAPDAKALQDQLNQIDVRIEEINSHLEDKRAKLQSAMSEIQQKEEELHRNREIASG